MGRNVTGNLVEGQLLRAGRPVAEILAIIAGIDKLRLCASVRRLNPIALTRISIRGPGSNQPSAAPESEKRRQTHPHLSSCTPTVHRHDTSPFVS